MTNEITKSIVLCDDEVHILRAAEFKFARSGYEVRCASEGEEAWTLIQEKRPDIVITDYQMPVLDGMQLALRIHQDPELHELPVIMLSAKGFEIPKDKVKTEYGISAVLPKPFSPRELLKCAEQVLATGAYQRFTAVGPS